MGIVDFFSIYFSSVITLLLILLVYFYTIFTSNKYFKQIDVFVLVSFLIFYMLLFGLRNVNIGTDTIRYIEDYYLSNKYQNFDVILNRSKTGRDPFFVYFTMFTSKLGSKNFYLLLISALYIIGIYFLIKKITKQYYIIVLFSILCFGFFYSLGINIIRNGISITYSVLGLLILLEEDKKSLKEKVLGITLLIIGILFHSSSIIYVVLFFILRFIKIKLVWYYILFLLTTVLAILKFSFKNLPIIGDYVNSSERMEAYISGEASQPPSGVTLYILIFQYLTFFYCIYFEKRISDKKFLLLVKSYLLLSSFYFLCLDISFSDRFGMLCWVFMPFILAYPVIYKRKINYQYFLIFIFLSLFYLLLTYYRVDFEQ